MKRFVFKRHLVILAVCLLLIGIMVPIATFAKSNNGEPHHPTPSTKHITKLASGATTVTITTDADCHVSSDTVVSFHTGDTVSGTASLVTTVGDPATEASEHEDLFLQGTNVPSIPSIAVDTGSHSFSFIATGDGTLTACVGGSDGGDGDELGTITGTVTSAQITTFFTFKTDRSCDAPVPTQVIFTFTADTQADFSAILNSSDPKEASQGEVLKIFSNFGLGTVTSKPGQLVNQGLFNVSAGDKLFACVTKANGDENGVIVLGVRNIKFVRLQRLAEFLATAAKCALGLAGGVLVNATLAITDIVLGHFSAADAILRNLPIPRKACIELAGSVLGFH